MRPQEQLAPDASPSAKQEPVMNPVPDPYAGKHANQPQRAANAKGMGLALSGGGFRATLFHLGVIAYLRDANRLQDVTHITAVSGGSIAAAHLVLNWEKYTGEDEEFDAAASEIIKFVKQDIRGRILRRIPLYFPIYWFSVLFQRLPFIDDNWLGWWTRVSTTDLLRRYYSQSLFNKHQLIDLKGTPDRPRPKLYLLATNIDDAQQASFTSYGFHIGTYSYNCELKDLGVAVAASSAFPGMFPSVVFQPKRGKNRPVFRLIDGGVFDNLGVKKFWDLITVEKTPFEEIIVSDASVEFKPAARNSFLEPITTPFRAADILFKRVYDFERERAEQRDKETKEINFRFIRLLDRVDSSTDELALFAEYQDELYSVRTDLDVFSDLEIAALVRHGYCVARSKLDPEYTVRPKTNGNGGPPNPWNPIRTTRSRPARALIDRDPKRSEYVLKHLSRSSVRRYRFISTRDWATYLTLVFVVLIAGILVAPYFERYWHSLTHATESLGLAQSTDQKVLDALIGDANRDYKRLLLGRKINSAQTKAFVPDPKRQYKIETWSTAQATYALLEAGNLSGTDVRFLADSLESRFTQPPSGQDSDVVPSGGFYTRPTEHHLQADPTLWMMLALTRTMREPSIDPATKERLSSRLRSLQDYMAANNFYAWENDELVFNLLANQTNRDVHSAYTTALALMALVELRLSDLEWGDQRDVMIAGILKWFNNNYGVAGRGWKAVDNDTELDVPDEAVNLQILATMLKAYQVTGTRVPADINRKVIDHLQTLGKNAPNDSQARVLLDSESTTGRPAGHEIRITFLGKPWAIRLCRAWLADPSNAEATAQKSQVLSLLQTLVDGLDESLEKDKSAFTFRSSEMLIALS